MLLKMNDCTYLPFLRFVDMKKHLHLFRPRPRSSRAAR